MYLVFTRMPGESYRRQLRSSLLYLCYLFRALIDPVLILHERCGPRSVSFLYCYFFIEAFGLTGSTLQLHLCGRTSMKC